MKYYTNCLTKLLAYDFPSKNFVKLFCSIKGAIFGIHNSSNWSDEISYAFATLETIQIENWKKEYNPFGGIIITK